MTIRLVDILPIERPWEYKLHLARYNQVERPLDVSVRSREEWRDWQEFRPRTDQFSCAGAGAAAKSHSAPSGSARTGRPKRRAPARPVRAWASGLRWEPFDSLGTGPADVEGAGRRPPARRRTHVMALDRRVA